MCFVDFLSSGQSRVSDVEVGLSIIIVLSGKIQSVLGIGSGSLGIKVFVVGIIEDGLSALEVVPGDVVLILSVEVGSHSSIVVSLSLMKGVAGFNLSGSGGFKVGISLFPDSLSGSELLSGDSEDLIDLFPSSVGNFIEVLSSVEDGLSLVLLILGEVENILSLGEADLGSFLLVVSEVN